MSTASLNSTAYQHQPGFARLDRAAFLPFGSELAYSATNQEYNLPVREAAGQADPIQRIPLTAHELMLEKARKVTV